VLFASRGYDKNHCRAVDVLLFVRQDGSTEERAAAPERWDGCT